MPLFANNPKPKPIKAGVITGLLELAYIFILIATGNQVAKILQNMKKPEILGPMLFLIIFVFSAAISAILIFGYPAYLFFIEKKLKEALTTAVSTLFTLAISGVILFILMISV